MSSATFGRCLCAILALVLCSGRYYQSLRADTVVTCPVDEFSSVGTCTVTVSGGQMIFDSYGGRRVVGEPRIGSSYTSTCVESADANREQAIWVPPQGTGGSFCPYVDVTRIRVDNGWLTVVTCARASFAVCDARARFSPQRPPCTPTFNGAGIALNCANFQIAGNDWNELMTAQSFCPHNTVERAPYPRAAAAIPFTMTLLSESYGYADAGRTQPHGEAGVWSPEVTPFGVENDQGEPTGSGLVGHLRLGVRTQRLVPGTQWVRQVPQFGWKFNDGARVINDAGGSVTYQFEASSFGQPAQGRRFDFAAKQPADVYDLPAYPVTVASTCGLSWALQYRQSEAYEVTSTNTLTTGQVITTSVTKFRWSEVKKLGEDWNALDLAGPEYGLPTPWLPVSGPSLSRSGGVFNGVEYRDAVPGVWIPVTEAQSVLRSEDCVQDLGQCPRD